MKKYFTFFLIYCFLLNIFGCYSNNTILKEDYSNYKSTDKELHIKLKDGRTIISKEYEHVAVNEPSEFVLGKAEIIDGINYKADVGTYLLQSQIDSIITIQSGNKGLICYSEGKKYFFNNEDYFLITKNTEQGFWVKGKIAETGSKFYGRLERGEIISIDAREINVVNTILFVSGIAVIILSLIGIALYASGSSEPNSIYYP